LEVLVEQIVPDHPFDTIAIGGAAPGLLVQGSATKLNTHCRSPSSTLSLYCVAQLRMAATSCAVGLRLCACAVPPHATLRPRGKAKAEPSCPHRVFSKISRPISMRRISLVPAPIS